MKRRPLIRIAGLREAGVSCPSCTDRIVHGQETITCDDCGSVHHATCWKQVDGCAQFDCASAVVLSADHRHATIHITASDLKTARPLPVSRPPSMGPRIAIPVGPDPESLRWNQLAVASFITALISFPLFGIVTGLLAVAIGAASLVTRNAFRRKGLPFAAMGIMLGIVSFVGWTVYLASTGDPSRVAIALDDFEPDPEALNGLPPTINRAMKANVLIQTGGMFQSGIGSGVILRIKDGTALIVTNRHVIDSRFADGDTGNVLADIAEVVVKAIGQPGAKGNAVWLAPEGIDLALITMPVTSQEIMSAAWDVTPQIQVGDAVFAVGNPHGLGWTHTSGDVSQMRRQRKQKTDYGVIQTSAAINPGNSGGGLYDSDGHLIGINTWTQDKRFAEGLGFAIVFQTLYQLLDGELDLPERQLPIELP